MKASEKLLTYIKQHEGFSPKAIFDDYAGTTDRVEYAIGYGHQIQPHEEYLMNVTLTKARADEILKNDLPIYEKYVNDNIKVKLNQDQFDALVNLCYAAGGGAFIKSGLPTLINSNASEDKIKKVWQYLSVRWQGKVLPGLVRMRQYEMDLFFKNYNSKPVILISIFAAALLSFYFIFSKNAIRI